MESANNASFEHVTNEECRKECITEELRGTVYQQKDIPEILQEIKSPLQGESMDNEMETPKVEKDSTKDLERLCLKRKLESEGKPAVRKEPCLADLENQPIAMLLSHIPLKSLMEVEMKLVYTDEEDVTYEFLESQASTSEQQTFPEDIRMDSQRLPDLNALPQMDKWLQVSLKDASTCYRQKKYAMAAGQFRTALERELNCYTYMGHIDWKQGLLAFTGKPL
ncbi:Spermatogenesis-associated protein 16 [Varanus komodoensis]|nr:Spermatogenesis-associated protein 16 [Varanus komodoensis]